jgi:sensor histidine kinase regulating citrate/malate metabolism
MCIILGNLLENAVEACQKPDGGGKIELAVNTQGKLLAVMVKNNFSDVIMEENGLLLSTKKNGGYGLRSVRAVAARYGGQVLTEWDDTAFCAYVLVGDRQYNSPCP